MFIRIIAGAGCVLAGVTLPVPEAGAQRSPSPLEDTCDEAALALGGLGLVAGQPASR